MENTQTLLVTIALSPVKEVHHATFCVLANEC